MTGYVTPLDCLPIQDRELVLQGWATSRLPVLRGLHASLTALAISFWVRTSPTLGRVLGYPRVPAHGSPAKDGYPFRFLQFPPTNAAEPETINADVVIVGSGCGGAVAAKTLAEAGLKVLVVDKGYYWSPLRLPMSELEGSAHLFDNGGLMLSEGGKVTIAAGSSWGGGGTVNWSASLQTQGYVRHEWSQKFGLKYFTSAEFQRDLDSVCDRMGVGTTEIQHNKTNEVLLEGARKLGWSAKTVPQNTGGEAHNCGYCTLGCGSCGKKGPTETFLPDAAEAGAQFIEGFECAEVLFEDFSSTGKRTAVGVRGRWTARDSAGNTVGPNRTTRELIIKAPRVIVSAGSIATPLLLKRSGLTNTHIGRHLHLHPVSMMCAVWDDEVRPWEGSILTSVVNEFENLTGDGYGAKLEATTMLPGMFLPAFPWRSALHAKTFAANMKRTTGYISLARDRNGGTVNPTPEDPFRPKISYTASATDKNSVQHGLERLAELLYVAGAREIHSTLPNVPPFIRPSPDSTSRTTLTPIAHPSLNDAAFQAWRTLLQNSGGPVRFASAHQMGSCRMGTTEANSAIDEKGRVWGTEGLWVADAGVFPSASGVNPMITNMGIARGIARGVAEEFVGGSGEKAKL